MRTENYISFIYEDEKEKQDSPFQCKAIHPRAFYENNTQELRNELNKYFFWMLFESDIEMSDKFDFLDYHLMKYTGRVINFLDFVKKSPVQPMEVNAPIEMEITRREQCRSYLYEWIELKKIDGFKTNGSEKVKLSWRNDDGRLKLTRKDGKPVDSTEIREWFTRELLHSKFKGESVITPQDFEIFLHASFAIFKEKATIDADKKLTVNADGVFLKNVMYRFYIEFRKSSKDKLLREGVSEILLNTFKIFNSYELNTISGSLQRPYVPK